MHVDSGSFIYLSRYVCESNYLNRNFARTHRHVGIEAHTLLVCRWVRNRYGIVVSIATSRPYHHEYKMASPMLSLGAHQWRIPRGKIYAGKLTSAGDWRDSLRGCRNSRRENLRGKLAPNLAG